MVVLSLKDDENVDCKCFDHICIKYVRLIYVAFNREPHTDELQRLNEEKKIQTVDLCVKAKTHVRSNACSNI